MENDAVICALDVNDFDQDVVELAARFAKHFSASLHLLHVTSFPDPSNAAWPAYLGCPNVLIDDNRRLRTIECADQDVELVRHHLSGMPAERIVDFVNRNKARLLVLGTHGYQGLQRIFGSVASKIMRQAKCPTMVLRQNSSKLAIQTKGDSVT